MTTNTGECQTGLGKRKAPGDAPPPADRETMIEEALKELGHTPCHVGLEMVDLFEQFYYAALGMSRLIVKKTPKDILKEVVARFRSRVVVIGRKDFIRNGAEYAFDATDGYPLVGDNCLDNETQNAKISFFQGGCRVTLIVGVHYLEDDVWAEFDKVRKAQDEEGDDEAQGEEGDETDEEDEETEERDVVPVSFNINVE